MTVPFFCWEGGTYWLVVWVGGQFEILGIFLPKGFSLKVIDGQL